MSETDEHLIPRDLPPEKRSAFLKQEMQKTATDTALNQQLAQYMFWGATTLMGLAIGAPFLDGGNTLASVAGNVGVSSTELLVGMGATSAAALAGSIGFSRKASDTSERNDMLYSKNQARDIARAISYEQQHQPTMHLAQAEAPTPVRADGKSWVEFTSQSPTMTQEMRTL